jgi:DNA-directed RNA polymerase specialized sigma24 family protein
MRSQAREETYVEFVTARQTHLRRIAYAICGDWHQADDVLQTALTKLYVAWPRVQRGATEEAYVRRIIVRATIDEHLGPGAVRLRASTGSTRRRPSTTRRTAPCSSRRCSPCR